MGAHCFLTGNTCQAHLAGTSFVYGPNTASCTAGREASEMVNLGRRADAGEGSAVIISVETDIESTDGIGRMG